MTLECGTVINGRYEILKQNGKGDISVVYLALDLKLSKQLAVKVIQKKDISKGNEFVLNKIYDYIKFLKRLDHPAIPKIVDFIETNDYFAIVMDYIEGLTLEKIIKNYGKQHQTLVIDWIIQICDALRYLHNQKPPCIHGNVAPENIILQPCGNISVVDIGVIRIFNYKHISDIHHLETNDYVAPEQYINGKIDERSDIFGVGMTMYRLLSGSNTNYHVGQSLPIRIVNPNVAARWERIIQKCTEPNPDNRYQSIEELYSDLH